MGHSEELSGTIERLLFQSSDNGYTVFVLQPDGKNAPTVTVKGHMPSIQPGQQVTLNGSWITHPKFGKQFDAKTCAATMPNSIVGIKRYLGSGLIKGIGPAYADKLVDAFGSQVLHVIEHEPHRLARVEGIGPKRLEMITQAWKDQKEISNIMVFLQDKGITTAYAIKIYKTYGQNSITYIQENPYRIAEDIWGVGFKTADQIAQNLGFDKHSLKRIRAGILFVITSTLNNGNLYIELEKLKESAIELLELDTPDTPQQLKLALHDLYNQEKIKLLSVNDEHFVTLTQYYFCEKGVAQKIQTLLERPPFYTFNTDAVYTSLRAPKDERDIVLNEEQQLGIMTCLQNKVSIITGGPGTGKTTLIKKLLSILDDHQISYKLAAPTGRAAKRIIEGTGRHASTIHRLLEFDFNTRAFVHNEQNALKTNYLIIDEASMIDIFLAHAILKAVPHDAHLIFIGDVNQLPSVGAGNFLNDLIASEKVSCIRLKQIFRQAQDSLIIVNAHRINDGEYPVTNLPDAKNDFIFIKEEDPNLIPQHLEHVINKGLRRYGIAADQSIVLSPMNRGIAGTQKLNQDLQGILNSTANADHVLHSGTTYKVGDRVMQIRNNYDKRVFNGDIGTIDEIDMQEKMLSVKFLDTVVEYDFSELDELLLAYAISIHKSQGSEYQAVIIPIFMQHFMLLQRNLIYTAITRAKKLCILIGQPKALAIAINNNKGLQRTTFLQHYLTSDLQCR